MAETVAAKPAFHDAIRRRRCLVPADFFYALRKLPTGKQPYAVGFADGLPIVFARFWERWTERETGGTLHTFAIIAGPLNELVAPIHTRMSVILTRVAWRQWLGEDQASVDELLGMLRPYPAELMRAYPVARRVGNVRNNDPDLLPPWGA